MGFLRQEYWSGLLFPSPGDLPYRGIKPVSSALAGRFFTTEPPGKLLSTYYWNEYLKYLLSIRPNNNPFLHELAVGVEGWSCSWNLLFRTEKPGRPVDLPQPREEAKRGTSKERGKFCRKWTWRWANPTPHPPSSAMTNFVKAVTNTWCLELLVFTQFLKSPRTYSSSLKT